jgi:hypothetical protein
MDSIIVFGWGKNALYARHRRWILVMLLLDVTSLMMVVNGVDMC